MSESAERLEVAALGARVVVRPAGAACAAGDLTFDVVGRPRGFITQPHVHAHQVERFEVLAGSMRLRLDGRTHVLRPGDRMEVPAGSAHRQQPAGADESSVRVTVSPAGRTLEFLRDLAELSAGGQFTASGLPRPVAGARLILQFGETGHAAFPPLRVQRLLARLILRGARVAGAAQTLGGRARGLWRPYAFIDEWDVAAPVAAVFPALADARTYPRWWRPVYLEVVADGPPRVGTVSHHHFKGRLPYHLRTRSTIVRLEPGELVAADVDGDLQGRGVWALTPTPTGTHVRFDWTVRAARPLLRVLTPFLRPVLRANHSWAIARASAGLEPYARATAERPHPEEGVLNPLPAHSPAR